jgi:DNA polymerase-3 subunit alpha
MAKPYWSLHNHSRYSANDAISPVAEMAGWAADHDYPALGLTDHGGVPGVLQLYKSCRNLGVEPLPGVELYVSADRELHQQGNNLHLTVTAYSTEGYRNLCKLTTLTARNFYYKPKVDFADFAKLAEQGLTQGLAVSTGCWFGVLPVIMREQGPAAAAAMIETFKAWFPRVYVELQAHGVVDHRDDNPWSAAGLTEADMVESLIYLANTTGTPYIITSDAHYTYGEDQDLHDRFKTMCSWSETDPDDAAFPGGPYCMQTREDLEPYFSPEVIDSACDTLADLAERAHVRIPELDTYTMLVPDVVVNEDPATVLAKKAREGLYAKVAAGLIPKSRLTEYEDRLDTELDILAYRHFDPYVLLVDRICEFMRAEGIVFNARGSANNCLTLWVIDITRVDPIRWKLRMERFISRDRIKPPDIDLDIERRRRGEVAAKLESWYPTVRVGSHGTYSLWDEDEEEGKGSLRTRYYSTLNKQGRPKPRWLDLPKEDVEALEVLSSRRLFSGYGKHASGYVVAPDAALLDTLPLVWIASSKSFITAYDKNDVEDLGFTKIDLLGLRTMSALAIACDHTGIVLEEIPLNDSKVYARIARGAVESCFQLSGYTQLKGYRRMKPKNMADLILGQALFRPGASGAESYVLARRRGREPVPEQHPDLAAETAETYGELVYQEQVLGCLSAIGLSIEDINSMLKAVKASNQYVEGARRTIAEITPRIQAAAEERGWPEDDIALLVEAVAGYADYGFGKGHATAYALMAYWTAWMCEHHPLAWWHGTLVGFEQHDKENLFVKAARGEGVRVMPAHVNESDVSYTLDTRRNAIRKGLIAIKDIGEVAATELVANAPYTSLKDLGQRCLPRRVSGAGGLAIGKHPRETGEKTKAVVLYEAGALEGLE